MLARLVAQSKSRPDVSFGRALLVAAIIGFWMLAVSARLVYLQVSQHQGLVNRARQQQQNAIETSPQRGDLIDRQGRELARSVQTVSLFVDPDQLTPGQLVCTATELAKVLGENETDLFKQLQGAQDGSAASFGSFVDSTRNKRHRFWR
jgi:cell division protein FtsI/penicillin-binding protein 2